MRSRHAHLLQLRRVLKFSYERYTKTRTFLGLFSAALKDPKECSTYHSHTIISRNVPSDNPTQPSYVPTFVRSDKLYRRLTPWKMAVFPHPDLRASHSFLSDPRCWLDWAGAPPRGRCLGWAPFRLIEISRFLRTRATYEDWRPLCYSWEIRHSCICHRHDRRSPSRPWRIVSCRRHRGRFGF